MGKLSKIESMKTALKKTASKKTAVGKAKPAKSKVGPSKEKKAQARGRAIEQASAGEENLKEILEYRPSVMSSADHMRDLKRRLLEISDIGAAGSLLDWDQSTYMPSGGAVAR